MTHKPLSHYLFQFGYLCMQYAPLLNELHKCQDNILEHFPTELHNCHYSIKAYTLMYARTRVSACVVWIRSIRDEHSHRKGTSRLTHIDPSVPMTSQPRYEPEKSAIKSFCNDVIQYIA